MTEQTQPKTKPASNWKADEDVKEICENIMKIREKIGDETYGEKTLTKVMSGTLTSIDLTKIAAKISNKMEEVGL